MKILIVDDDPQMIRALRIPLTVKGYYVVTANSGPQAIEVAAAQKPDVYLLDLGMPGMDGLAVIRAVRAWSSAPILVASGRAGQADKVRALDEGADDYLTKPFSIDELLSRIQSLTRRMPQLDASPIVEFGEVKVNFAARTVTRATSGATIRLTPTEWLVLGILSRQPGQLVTRQQILTEIWGPQHATDTGYLRLYIAQLRKKLEPDPARPAYIVTDAGTGYRLMLPTESHSRVSPATASKAASVLTRTAPSTIA